VKQSAKEENDISSILLNFSLWVPLTFPSRFKVTRKLSNLHSLGICMIVFSNDCLFVLDLTSLKIQATAEDVAFVGFVSHSRVIW